MTVLAEFTPEFETYSIDEAFLNLSEFAGQNLTQYARMIQARVWQWTGYPHLYWNCPNQNSG